MTGDLNSQLAAFAEGCRFGGKGALCVALVVTRHAVDKGLPLNPDELLTEGGGQVLGLGKAAVQNVLSGHGIQRVLAEEGGRTSRGSVGNMRKYADFLNDQNAGGEIDLAGVEAWWVDRVRDYFAAKPLKFRFDASKSMRAAFRDVLEQVQKRQAESPGATFAGTVLQHLVGAKLVLLMGPEVEHHGASVADESSGRDADYLIEDVAIHITTSPGEAVIRKCVRNIEAGLKPILITLQKGALVADGLTEREGCDGRIDIFEAEQFLAGNLYEIGKFGREGRRATAEELVKQYNAIVDECETDPSLKIEVSK